MQTQFLSRYIGLCTNYELSKTNVKEFLSARLALSKLVLGRDRGPKFSPQIENSKVHCDKILVNLIESFSVNRSSKIGL